MISFAKDIDPAIAELCKDYMPIDSSAERALGYIVLSGHKAQVTVKIATDEDEWISD